MTIAISGWTLRSDLYTVGSRIQPQVSQQYVQAARDAEFAQKRFAAFSAELRDASTSLQTILGGIRLTQTPRAASVVGKVNVGVPIAARLSSSAEINARTTAFSPANPLWQGSSRADPTVTGNYTGDQGTGALTVTATSGGNRRTRDITLDLRDSGGGFVEEIVLLSSDPIDMQYQLSNGLVLQFENGTILTGDTFTIDVQDQLDLEIDPDVPFDGYLGDPGFDIGESVVSGSFFVNGINIAVFSSDTVNDVLSRIESSSAGVTATYDSQTEAVILTQKTAGTGATFSVSNDTSGFLSAVKLDNAVLEPGQDGGADVPISRLPPFAGVTTGSILINNVAVSINPAVDSLTEIVSRIDSSSAGVSARLVANERVVLRSEDDGAALELSSNGTGFFEAVQIFKTVIEPRLGSQRPSEAATDEILGALRKLTFAFNQIAGDPYTRDLPATKRLRSQTEAAFRSGLEQGGISELDIGIRMNRAESELSLEFVGASSTRARDAVRRDFSAFRAFYSGSVGSSGGVLSRLVALVNQSLAQLPASLRVGSRLDLNA
jgi:hypothetical protein